MSIRIFINNELKGRADSSANRIVRNLGNTARQIGKGLAVNFVKKRIYNLILPNAVALLDFDGLLAVSDYATGMPVFSPYPVSNLLMPVRNAVVFETNDKSVKVYLYDVKIDVSFENTIVKTPLVKRKGTVKEFISANDYAISMQGSLIADSQYLFPIDELKLFVKLFQVEENMSIYNVFLSQFDITKVVLEGANLPQNSAKFVNTMPFSLRMISDQDYELQIEEEK